MTEKTRNKYNCYINSLFWASVLGSKDYERPSSGLRCRVTDISFMKPIFICFTLALLGACSFITPHQSGLYDAYQIYANSVDSDNVRQQAADFFSEKVIGTVPLAADASVEQLLFRNYMADIRDHYESVQKQYGCLTVNGYDDDKQPVQFNLGYRYQSERWLIDDIHVLLLDSEEGFDNNSHCAEYLRSTTES